MKTACRSSTDVSPGILPQAVRSQSREIGKTIESTRHSKRTGGKTAIPPPLRLQKHLSADRVPVGFGVALGDVRHRHAAIGQRGGGALGG